MNNEFKKLLLQESPSHEDYLATTTSVQRKKVDKAIRSFNLPCPDICRECERVFSKQSAGWWDQIVLQLSTLVFAQEQQQWYLFVILQPQPQMSTVCHLVRAIILTLSKVELVGHKQEIHNLHRRNSIFLFDQNLNFDLFPSFH